MFKRLVFTFLFLIDLNEQIINLKRIYSFPKYSSET